MGLDFNWTQLQQSVQGVVTEPIIVFGTILEPILVFGMNSDYHFFVSDVFSLPLLPNELD